MQTNKGNEFMRSIFRCIAVAMLLPATSDGAFNLEQAAPRAIEIHAQRFSFTPAAITIHKGEAVTLSVTAGDATHGLSIPELGVNATFPKGKVTQITLTPQQTGVFAGRCNNFCGAGHGSMMLSVEVKDK